MLTRTHRMTLDEARLILNLGKQKATTDVAAEKEVLLKVREAAIRKFGCKNMGPLSDGYPLRTELRTPLCDECATGAKGETGRGTGQLLYPEQSCAGKRENRGGMERGNKEDATADGRATSTIAVATTTAATPIRWRTGCSPLMMPTFCFIFISRICATVCKFVCATTMKGKISIRHTNWTKTQACITNHALWSN